MESKGKRGTGMNGQPPHTPEHEARAEKWKTRPSTETNADDGENARTEREQKIEQNAPSRSRRH
jgi:hypothetical protein